MMNLPLRTLAVGLSLLCLPPMPAQGGARTGAGSGPDVVPPAAGLAAETGNPWDWWWAMNKPRFLALRMPTRAEGIDGVLKSDGLPFLRRAVRCSSCAPTRAAALIALGKIGTAEDQELRRLLRSALADPHQDVRMAACLALGFVGASNDLPLLREVALATAVPEGLRDQFGGRHEFALSTRVAALSAIGMIGHRLGASSASPAQNALLNALCRPAEPRDYRVASMVALQLVPMREVPARLLDAVLDEDEDAYVRAHGIVAIGKAGDRTAMDAMQRLLAAKNRFVAQAAAIALGLLAEPGDAEVQAALQKAVKAGADRDLRNFAIIALGEAGGPRSIAFLERLLARGQLADRTYAALALGIAGWNERSLGPPLTPSLMAAYRRCKEPNEKGAYTVALGLLDAQSEAEGLLEDFTRSRSSSWRQHACLALGLLQVKIARKPLLRVALDREDPSTRVAAILSLGCLNDRSDVMELAVLITTSFQTMRLAAATATTMGCLGTPELIARLAAELPEDAVEGSYQVALAAITLGCIGDKDRSPLLWRLHQNSQYLLQTTSLRNLLRVL